MTSSSIIEKGNASKVNDVQLIRNEAVKPPKFRAYLEIASKGDAFCALSSIPPRIIMIHDVRSCYICKIGETGDFEIRNVYDRLCIDGKLKDEHKHIVEARITRALDFPKFFKVEWIKIILMCAREMKL